MVFGMGLRGLVAVGIVVGLLAPQVTWSDGFQYTFGINTNLLAVNPSVREGLLREADSIALTSSNNATIRLLNLDKVQLYQGAPTNFHLARGHYLVETQGDRTQFVVLPNDY